MSDHRTTTECMCWKCGRIATLEAQNAALVEALCPVVARGGVWHVGELDRIRSALTPDATQAAAAFVERIRAEEREATTEEARIVAKKLTAQHVAEEREACAETLAAMHRCREHDLESCPGANAEYLRAYVAAIRARGKDGGT